ncbi:ABC transporter ATP-binding protein [Planctopirus hydrillae]|uniref:ABC transporter ATP-binding protein n=1 Tax=Planctopirus hydrillae TaxID=1841610 RepID=UPI0009F4E709|nr:ABC transporter ATP-binding protein [Planctopirus hydrillae]
MSTPFLEARGLKKTFGSHQAVKNVSFSIMHGEAFGLLGPNGAGKSTTIRMLAGLMAPDAGEVLLEGEPAWKHPEKWKRQLGLAPQQLALYPELSAIENIRFFGGLYGLKGAALSQRTDELLELVGLEDAAHRIAANYSGGMQRRLNLAITLVHKPRLVILDEPTVGVDPQSRAHLLESVRQLARDGTSIIYVSHYMEEVEALCRRVAIIDHGVVLECGVLDQLLGSVPTQLVLHVRPANSVDPVRTGHDPSSSFSARLQHIARRVDPEATGVKVSVGENAESLPTVLIETSFTEWPDRLHQLSQAFHADSILIDRVESRQQNLERLFLQLTGRALRA